MTHRHTQPRSSGTVVAGISDESRWVSACSSLIPVYGCRLNPAALPPLSLTISLPVWLAIDQFLSLPWEIQPDVKSVAHSVLSVKAAVYVLLLFKDMFNPFVKVLCFVWTVYSLIPLFLNASCYHRNTKMAGYNLYIQSMVITQFVSYGALAKPASWQTNKPLWN